ncbi:MAG: 5'/3'-nucleotidase SurE [Clostridiales Family XIII bacterium]|jgi:5'-nucleotidase|nr:5'/3'-nucleotidase SurE [Clostridiales Family XIII bacterium]
MNILAVNDDGIDAIGLLRLSEALQAAGKVYVCAPARQQSASGHGITIGRPVYIEDVPFAAAEMAISMEGTPADCVKIGLEVYKDRGVEMDMVFSGFNHGMNLGTDTLYSGTVAAAVEGALCGLPSAALSISSNLSAHREPAHFGFAMRLAAAAARSPMFSARFGDKNPRGPAARPGLGLDFIYRDHTILNINIPDLPDSEIRGVKAAPLSYREYDEWFKAREEDDGRVGYHYSGRPHVVGQAGAGESDIIANTMGFATITPLQFDLTNRKLLEAVRAEWEHVVL